MSDKQNNNNEIEKMQKRYQKSTGMPVVQQEKPNQGKTEFAKDRDKNKR